MSSNIKVQRICQHCGEEFTARTISTQYCGDICAKKAYKARIRNNKVEATNLETQRIKAVPIDELKAKAFLSIAESCILLGISRRTIYRMLERGELIAGKAGKRTILRRSDFDKLFEKPIPVNPPQEIKPLKFDIKDCYNLTEVQNKYGISEKALYEIIKRNNIPKLKKGWYVHVPKKEIDSLFQQKQVVILKNNERRKTKS